MAAKNVVFVGNWKMYKTGDEAKSFVRELAEKIEGNTNKVYLAVPYTAIRPAADAAEGTPIVIGAQNMNDASEGAFTGEIAGRMLKEANAQFVILGHSERRHIFYETSDFVNRKLKKALQEGLEPIVCIGETLQERDEKRTEKVLEEQLTQSFAGISAAQMEGLMIAYEPVWAIGTGRTASPKEAEEAHEFCRSFIKKNWSDKVAKKSVILYGGSVKPDNVGALLEQPNINGVLVGGASLSVESFSKIINYQSGNV